MLEFPSFGLSFFKAKPPALPSVPGKVNAPAPPVHVAEAALAVKSQPVPEDEVTLISTQKDLFQLFKGITFRLFGFKPILNMFCELLSHLSNEQRVRRQNQGVFFLSLKKGRNDEENVSSLQCLINKSRLSLKKRIKKILASLYPSQAHHTHLARTSHTPRTHLARSQHSPRTTRSHLESLAAALESFGSVPLWSLSF